MRSDKNAKNAKQKEIDEFLSRFDDEEADINLESYIDDDIASPKASSSNEATGDSPKYGLGDYADNDFNANGTIKNTAESDMSSIENTAKSESTFDNISKSKKKNAKITKKRKETSVSNDANTSVKETKSFSNLIKKGKDERLLDYLFMKENPNYNSCKGNFYMKNGKKIKNNKKSFSIAKLFRNLIAIGILLSLCFFLYAFIVISTSPKIDPKNIYDQVAESSILYDDKGAEADSIYYTQNRKIVKYDDIPKNMINAVVALEDKTFWKHHGFNWTRMIGAVLQSASGSGKISGTSTITQQLARNVYLPETKSVRSIKRKVLEMYYAGRIEKELSKKQIVEAYLNTIYLGFGNYGLSSASKSYFSCLPKDLTLEQCAAIAALPQAPDQYALLREADSKRINENSTNIVLRSPGTYLANDESKDRRNLCLDLMLKQGYIDKEKYNTAYNKPLIKFIKPTVSVNSGSDAYFKDYMIDELTKDLMDKYKLKYEEAERMIYTGGLKIYSTLDSQAQDAVTKEFKNDSNFPYLINVRRDAKNNIISDSGNIMLYAHSNIINSAGNFVMDGSECTVGKDGSVTIARGRRLAAYEIHSGGKTDYSLEFKQSYVSANDTIYIIPGGYINIPAKYKSLNKAGELVISSNYFKDHPKSASVKNNIVTFTKEAYSIPEKIIQPQGAMAIVEVGTGKLKAMSGGRGAIGQKLYNRAINPRQPGSSLKPLGVYSAALQKSYNLKANNQSYSYISSYDNSGTNSYGKYLTAASYFNDAPMYYGGKQWPSNAGGGFSGMVTMRRALQQSINVVAVKIQLQVGADFSADLIKKFGITTLETENKTENDLNPAALALGGMTKGTKPLEMAQAYATFPNGGNRCTTISYTKVLDRNGKTILEKKAKTHKVLEPSVAFIMTDLLKSVVSNGLGGPATVYGTSAGGKTGTTSNEFDIWFDGFTPKYAAALWIGADANIQLSSMSGTAAALWGRIMNQIDNAKTGEYKSEPSGVTYVGGEYFTTGTEEGRYFPPRPKPKPKKKAADKKPDKSPNPPANNNNGNKKPNQ